MYGFASLVYRMPIAFLLCLFNKKCLLFIEKQYQLNKNSLQ